MVVPPLLPGEIDGECEGMPAWMVRSFARRLVTGEILEPGAAHGLLITKVITAIHASLGAGEAAMLMSGHERKATWRHGTRGPGRRAGRLAGPQPRW